MFRKAKRLKNQSTISSCFRKISVSENAGQNMLSYGNEDEKYDGLKFVETRADSTPTSSLGANNLNSELKTVDGTLTSNHHEYRKNEINEGSHQPLDFNYPVNNGRKFQKSWFEQLPWLEY